jgi:hypothetical protein
MGQTRRFGAMNWAASAPPARSQVAFEALDLAENQSPALQSPALQNLELQSLQPHTVIRRNRSWNGPRSSQARHNSYRIANSTRKLRPDRRGSSLNCGYCSLERGVHSPRQNRCDDCGSSGCGNDHPNQIELVQSVIQPSQGPNRPPGRK